MTVITPSPLPKTANVITALFGLATLAGLFAPGMLPYLVWATLISGLHAWFFRLQEQDHLASETRKKASQRQQNPDLPVWELDEPRPVFHSPRLPSFKQKGQWIWLGITTLATGWLIWRVWSPTTPVLPKASLQLQIAIHLMIGVVLHLLGRYARVLGEKWETQQLIGISNLARFMFWVSLITVLSTGAMLLFDQDVRTLTAQFVSLVTAVLVLEALTQSVLQAYRPANNQEEQVPCGSSLILETFFNRMNPFEEISSRMEESLGLRMKDTWGYQFLRRAIGPVFFSAVFLTWISTIATVVPAGHTGVKVRFGTFHTDLAEPGLHWMYPWPFESMEVLPTKRVEEFLLGFEMDTGQPILWTERHYVGEKNLLVGNGDELLTISVPVQYRISDPLAYLMATTDAQVALEHLAYRELQRVAAARDSFAMMTDDRAAVSQALHKGLQEAADAQGLGLEVVWVGLRDIHPPVDVTAAYQEVVSAEEQKQTLIEQAHAYRAITLPSATQEANRLRVMSTATAQQRTLTAKGEAKRFQLLADSQEEDPDLFRTRVMLETQEQAWENPQKIIFASESTPNMTLDARLQGDTTFP